MGKVRKLRKKYKVFCSKNAAISKSCTKNKISKVTVLPSKNNGGHDRKLNGVLVCKRETELFKGTMKATTNHQKLLRSSSRTEANNNSVLYEVNTQETLQSQSSDKLSVSKKQSRRKTLNKKKKNHPQKRGSKIRQNSLFQEIYAFKKTLKEESFLKNPHRAVMNQTLERLSTECLSDPEKKMKDAHM